VTTSIPLKKKAKHLDLNMKTLVVLQKLVILLMQLCYGVPRDIFEQIQERERV